MQNAVQVVVAALVALAAADANAQTLQKRDSVANGIAIGALVGGATTFTLVQIGLNKCEPGCNEPDAPLALQAGLGGAAIGSVVGLLVDLAKKPKPASPTVRMGPILSTQKKGLAVRMRW
jgi:hypothetical protein